MTTIRQFSRIALTLLTMTGRVTMLGMSRWAGDGGSYRTVQHFFATVIPWAPLFWGCDARFYTPQPQPVRLCSAS